MKLQYFPETDSLYIELRAAERTEVRGVADGVYVDIDVDGNIVGFDIDQASQRCDLSALETIDLPGKIA